jgi:ankyrin repeat protein
LLTHGSGKVSHRSVGVEDERVSIRRNPPPFVMQKLPQKLQEKISTGLEQLKKANAELIQAVLVEDAYAVKKALGEGADPNAAFPGRVNPMTCLEQAAKTGNVKLIGLLLDHGADANLRVAEYSPLHSASAYGQLEAIKLLLKRGANPDQKPPADLQWALDRSVLDIAVLNRQKEVAQFWVEQGVPITELTWKIAASVAEFDKNNNTTVGQEILEWLKTKGATKDK